MLKISNTKTEYTEIPAALIPPQTSSPFPKTQGAFEETDETFRNSIVSMVRNNLNPPEVELRAQVIQAIISGAPQNSIITLSHSWLATSPSKDCIASVLFLAILTQTPEFLTHPDLDAFLFAFDESSSKMII